MRWTVPETTVEAFGRVHVGLVDLGRATPRTYGGCGFAVSKSVARVTARPATSASVIGAERLDDRGRQDVNAALVRLGRHVGAAIDAQFTIDGWLPQHVGLGTKTALLLALLDSANRALELSLSPADLQSVSGRGGTSGVGIHTYFRGGVAVDAGHPQESVPRLRPSGDRLAPAVPPLISWVRFPDRWRVTLILAPGPRIAGDDEIAFFQHETPTPPEDALRTLALVHHGVTPAMIDGDLERLASALVDLHRVGFKARELSHQSAPVVRALMACWTHGLAAGLSSMGPTIYVVTSAEDSSHDVLDEIAGTHGAALIGPLLAHNEGSLVKCP
jgi:beta-ribofuranosylaminobenzene 5'-phosphate synthase